MITQEEFLKQFSKGKIKGEWLVYCGSLSCFNNHLKELPDNLKVGGDLYCFNNRLEELPNNLRVGGDLYCYNNHLKELSDNLKVGGDLSCYNNHLKELPDNLRVGGDLYCYNNHLKELPNNLKVSGDLSCFNNQLKKLPDNLKVGGDLYPFKNTCLNNIELVNKILGDKLTAEEVFNIENTEYRRVAYENMDKIKMKKLKNYKVLDKVEDDGYGYPMKIISFQVRELTLKYLNVFCPSTGREYYLETQKVTCKEAKARSFGLDKDAVFDREY